MAVPLLQNVLQPMYQQMIPVNDEQHVLLEPRPSQSPEEEEALVEQVLLVSPDVNQRWLRQRAGYGSEYLINFIFENFTRIPLEPGVAKHKRIIDVSLEEGSFFVPPNQENEEGEEIREKKVAALMVYIKQLDHRKERFPKDFAEYVKRRYPTIRSNIITHLGNNSRLKNVKEAIAVCELIQMKAFNKDVAKKLHLNFLTYYIGTPWLEAASDIEARKKLAPIPAVGPYAEAHQEIDTILEEFDTTVSCAVCYDDVIRKRSMACSEDENDDDVHYVCHECLKGQGKALCTDGQLAEGGQGFRCVDPDCTNVLPWANVKRVLEKGVRKLLAKRLDNEAVLTLEGLEACKYCSFQMLIEAPMEELKVFSCQKCRAEFCRQCNRDWKDHMGRKCEEMQSVEDKKEEARKKLEEELAMAVMRKCHQCKVVFAKDDGCNKMKCRCGATQCYMCRAEYIDYKHFCPHVRDPNQPEMCPEDCPAKCLLWVRTADVDKAALQIVKDQAAMDRDLHDILNQLE